MLLRSRCDVCISTTDIPSASKMGCNKRAYVAHAYQSAHVDCTLCSPTRRSPMVLAGRYRYQDTAEPAYHVFGY
jgi:hypothetical protein